MTKKRLLVISVLLLALLGAGMGVTAFVTDGSGVTKANFDRIQEGMNKGEIEMIFGEKGAASGSAGCPGAIVHLVEWQRNDGAIATIWFRDDKVQNKFWEDSTETFLDNLP